MTGMTLPTLLVGLTTFAQIPDSTYFLETTQGKHIHAVLNLKINCPNVKAKEWALYVAEAPEFSAQRQVKTTVTPKGKERLDLSPLGRPLVELIFTEDRGKHAQNVNVQVAYDATLFERKLQLLKAGQQLPVVADLTIKERQQGLMYFGDFDYHKAVFQFWVKKNELIRQPQENPVDFARRVFLKIRSQYKYDYKTDMDRQASSVCQNNKADCGGLSILFATVLRANGIPARTLYGRWAKSSEPEAQVKGVAYHQGHVLAEFFARGVGWVPVDLASSILYDKSAQGLDHFGSSPGNFFTFHIDPNMIIHSQRFGHKEVHGLQQPGYFIWGGGSLEPTQFTLNWQVQIKK